MKIVNRLAIYWQRNLPHLRLSIYDLKHACKPSHACQYRLLSDFIPHGQVTYSSKKVNVVTPLYVKAEEFADRCAVEDEHGQHLYAELADRAASLSDRISDLIGEHVSGDDSPRIGFLCPNDVSYVVTQWAIWNSGCVAVPLCKQHPASEHQYFLENSESSLVITTTEFSDYMKNCVKNMDIKTLVLEKEDFAENRHSEHHGSGGPTEEEQLIFLKRQDRADAVKSLLARNGFKNLPALIIYTSGTTGRPKGVVHTYGSLQAQIDCMVSAWGWGINDTVLHVLPLHHVHGVVNVLMTPLSVGAKCIMLPKFVPEQVWDYLLKNPDPRDLNGSRINLFMAVPTIYAKLIEAHDKRFSAGASDHVKAFIRSTCSQSVRLMVSGSAALPVSVMDRWEEITGHRLLERYGMTETGMVLTNSLHGNRVPASVGNPFPKVEVLIAKPNVYAADGYDVIASGNHTSTMVTPGMEGEQGELYVKGPNLFKEYWRKPDATKATFSKDGWFKTGDTAVYEDGVYRIVGRTSVDIIKSGGYKISALDIEDHLLKHDDIREVAVMGLPDITWGQKVAAVVSMKSDRQFDLQELKTWAKDIMPSYQIPSALAVTQQIPRNAMGKVNKKELAVMMFPDEMKKVM